VWLRRCGPGRDSHRAEWDGGQVGQWPYQSRRPPRGIVMKVAGNANNQQPATSNRSKILIVDDEPSMRELLEIVLRREGHEVFTARNGRVAIELLEREPIEVLISDRKMPHMSGVGVLKAGKALVPDLVGIMVTAYASIENAAEAMHIGAYVSISKPSNVDEL